MELIDLPIHGVVEQYPCTCSGGDTCWIVRHPMVSPPISFPNKEEAEALLLETRAKLIYHLPDTDSPKTAVYINNPGYHDAEAPYSPFSLSRAELLEIWNDIDSPMVPMNMHSLAYCGAKLVRQARPFPESLYECINYVMPCSLVSIPEKRICWDCVKHLDQIRATQGYGPVMEDIRRELFGSVMFPFKNII